MPIRYGIYWRRSRYRLNDAPTQPVVISPQPVVNPSQSVVNRPWLVKLPSKLPS